MLENSPNLYIGQIWESQAGMLKREIVDLKIEGFDEDDPEDMGSFTEYMVYYTDHNSKYSEPDMDFWRWIKKYNAKLIFEPAIKKGWF